MELCKLDNLTEKEILESATLINTNVMNQIKENLHNLKGKFLYDYIFSIYQKGCKINVHFDSSNIYKEEDT